MLSERKTKAYLYKLIDNQLTIIQWLDYMGYMDNSEFDFLLQSLDIKFNSNLFERLFWLFDWLEDGVIDPQEVIKIINMIRDHNLFEKVNYFVGVCCESRLDLIDMDTIFKFFFKNLIYEEERKDLRKHVKEFLKEIKPAIKNKIRTKDLYNACLENEDIRMIVEKNI